MSEGTRRLSAILFTDMVGFTALTQADEAQSLAVLERHNSLLRPIFARFRGREVKTIGDSFLVEFDSALDATNCAIEAQRFLHDYNISSPDPWKITLRMGIHLGDVVRSGGDILGDAVNIASRLQPLAEPGGVCISEQVYDQVRNKIPHALVKLESYDMKGVAFSVDVYRVIMPWSAETPVQPVHLDRKRLVVLPFVSLSPDPNDEYFADGLTEELITSVSLVKGLEVIGRTSAMNYKKERKNLSQIGKELNVGTIMEGSVRKAGNRIRVTAQLINATTEGHLWASNYDRNLEDIFAVQSEIAEMVAGELKVQLLDSEKKTLEKKPTQDTESYTSYLKGMQLANQMEIGEEPLRKSLALFEQAAARDPKFALAYTGMVHCYAYLASWGYMPFQEGIDRGRAAALKALELDSDSAESHYSLATVAGLVDDFEEHRRQLKRALELNPNLAKAHLDMARLSACVGDRQEMVSSAEKAYLLDPLSPSAIMWVGEVYFYTGRKEEAMEHWKKTLHLEPYRTYRDMFDYYASEQSFENAEKMVKEMEGLGPTLPTTYLNRGFLAGLTGDLKVAQEMIAKLDSGKGGGWTSSSLAGYIYFALGDLDKFFEYMRSAVEHHTFYADTLRNNPLFKGAWQDPRFGELYRKMGLPYDPRV